MAVTCLGSSDHRSLENSASVGCGRLQFELGRRQIAETHVGPDRVVVATPLFDLGSGLVGAGSENGRSVNK